MVTMMVWQHGGDDDYHDDHDHDPQAKEFRQQVAESSRKMQELRAQIQVSSSLVSPPSPLLKISTFTPFKHQAQLKLAEHLRKMAEHGGEYNLFTFQILYKNMSPDLDEASRAELDAIQGNLAKLKGRKGLDDLDVDEWVDKNKRVK